MKKPIFTQIFRIYLRPLIKALMLLFLASAFCNTHAIAETLSKPSMLLVAEDYSLDKNGFTLVKWRSQDATQCSGDGNWTSSARTYGNQRVGPLTQTTAYRVTCSGPGGSVSKSLTIRVDNQQLEPEPEPEPEPELNGPKPSMLLVAEDYSLDKNGFTLVKWRSQDATQCSGDGNWTSSARTYGNQRVGPLTQTTAYRVTCSGPGGSVSKSLTIRVDNQQLEPEPEPEPELNGPKPSMLLVAEDYSLDKNGFTLVKWRSQDATQCSGDGNWTSSARTYGNQRVGPLTQTTAYRVTCSGPGGSVSKSLTIRVDNQQLEPEPEPEPELNGPKPSMLLVAEDYSLDKNGFTLVKWRSQDATQCSGDGNWTSSARTYGNQQVGPLTKTTTYRVTCSGPGGSVSKSITIVVANEDLPEYTGLVELSWLPPTTNKDGTPLFDLANYRVYYGSSQSNLNNIIDIDAGLTNYAIDDLSLGTHYFSISAIDLNGNESSRSNIAAKVVE